MTALTRSAMDRLRNNNIPPALPAGNGDGAEANAAPW